jgi:hypothetical protein
MLAGRPPAHDQVMTTVDAAAPTVSTAAPGGTAPAAPPRRLRDDPRATRAVVALTLFGFAEHAVWVMILVFAYRSGGALEAGVVAAALLVPAAVAAPVVARELTGPQHQNPLAIGYAVQLLTLTTLTVVLTLGVHSLVVYLAAGLVTITTTFTRPAHHAVIARSPVMVDATVATGVVSGAAQLGGPLLAAVVLVRLDDAAVAAVATILLAGATSVAMGIGTPAAASATPNSAATAARSAARPASPTVGVGAAMGDVLRDLTPPARRCVALLFSVLGLVTLVLGTIETVATEVSFDVLHLDDGGTGLLLGAMGAGLLLGAGLAGRLAARGREHVAVRVGAGLTAVALVTIAAPIGTIGGGAVMVAAFVVVGAGMQAVLVSGWIVLHRAVCRDRTSMVFGVLESQQLIGNGVGAIGAGVVIGQWGLWPLAIGASVLLALSIGAVTHERFSRLLAGARPVHAAAVTAAASVVTSTTVVPSSWAPPSPAVTPR